MDVLKRCQICIFLGSTVYRRFATPGVYYYLVHELVADMCLDLGGGRIKPPVILTFCILSFSPLFFSFV